MSVDWLYLPTQADVDALMAVEGRVPISAAAWDPRVHGPAVYWGWSGRTEGAAGFNRHLDLVTGKYKPSWSKEWSLYPKEGGRLGMTRDDGIVYITGAP